MSQRRLHFSRGTILRRKITNYVMIGLCAVCVVLALIPLALILFYTVREGIGAINLDFFTQLPKPVGEPGGGMANAIVGTLIMMGMSAMIGVPVGILCGVYLSEYGRNRFASVVRFLVEVMSGLPSIIVGIFTYALVVKPMGRFSAYAGAVALAVLMIPTITKTTDELLKLVPNTLREAALALGAPQWIVNTRIVLRAAAKGIVTAVMLSVARVAGETAPLLFTAMNNRFWHNNLDQPIASLPVQIYTYATSPYDDWHAQAWAGATVLIVIVFVLSVVVRVVSGGKFTVQQ
jgi:phosphate transport system permease protein